MCDLSSPGELGTCLFEKLRGQWLAAPISDFQQALNGAEIVPSGGQALGELVA
jgi:hypothetical protein